MDITYDSDDQNLQVHRVQRQPDVRKRTPPGRRGEMFEQIRTKLLGVPKPLLDPILRKKTVLISTNTRNDKSSILKILKRVLSKSAVIDSKFSENPSPVKEKGRVNIKMHATGSATSMQADIRRL
ncbi:hypothetical protein MA16_Dca028969 [Dendrobium catenatum]|uniref:Uncharacterized protein n=1 Tax=Dendrobium catenatum TaxID=906689 RepID=A0A2I0VGP0_9ASPA|nr:hypothetical protein MA16_Dca028969 [Dendrobium catenatum]